MVQLMTPDGERTALEQISLKYNIPSFGFLSRPFNRGRADQKVIALTFDGGSENNVSEEILDYLQALNIRCTFFLTGEFVTRFPETVKRIVADGHEVANHTMHHPHLTTFGENGRHDTRPEINREVLQKELRNMALAFAKLTGKKVAPFWRAPYGEHNREIRAWAAELGYREVGWTVGSQNGENMDTRDWVAKPTDPGYRTAAEIREMILNFARQKPHGANGGIILMHMASHRKGDFPHRQLPEIVAGLRELGYRFVTISELVNM